MTLIAEEKKLVQSELDGENRIKGFLFLQRRSERNNVPPEQLVQVVEQTCPFMERTAEKSRHAHHEVDTETAPTLG